MYYLVDICRVCLASGGSLISVTKAQATECDTLIRKLRTCVSEVEWNQDDDISLCKTCIEKLNSAFEFHTLCIRSNQTFKTYLRELNGDCKQTKLTVSLELNQVSKELIEDYVQNQPKELSRQGFLQVKPPNELFPIAAPNVVLANNQNQFFLSLIPTSNLLVQSGGEIKQPNTGAAQNNVFLHINNTLLKVLPLPQVPQSEVKAYVSPKLPVKPVSPKLPVEETKSEELSVEVDPSIFDCSDNEAQSEDDDDDDDDDEEKDWDDVITSSKIIPDTNMETQPLQSLLKLNVSRNKHESPAALNSPPLKNFVPILPKPTSFVGNEMDYLHVDHFMARKMSSEQLIICELCGKVFETPSIFRTHLNEFHTEEFPFMCEACPAAFANSSDYEAHAIIHKVTSNVLGNNVSSENEKMFPILSNILHKEEDGDGKVEQLKCDLCTNVFSSANGLSQHRRAKHGKPLKKYFIKGMKNAKCDICDRNFCTQSYLQLHKKLHLERKEFRGKVRQKTPAIINIENNIAPVVPTLVCDDEVQVKEELMETDELPTEPQENGSIKIKINLKDLPQLQNSLDKTDAVTELTEKSLNDAEMMNCDVSEEERDPLKDEVSLDEERRNPLTGTTINGKFQCNVCLKLFGRRHDLKRHMNNIHLKAIQYTCHLCNCHFYEAFHLTRHLRIHLGFVRCTECLKDFSSLRDLKMHVIGAHENNASMQCGVCGHLFRKVKKLRQHLMEHEKSIIYKCHICREDFTDPRELTRHLVGHSGLYSCSLCRLTFANEHELNLHTKNHGSGTCNEKKHECKLCHSKYKKRSNLLAHVRNAHKGATECNSNMS